MMIDLFNEYAKVAMQALIAKHGIETGSPDAVKRSVMMESFGHTLMGGKKMTEEQIAMSATHIARVMVEQSEKYNREATAKLKVK